MSTTIISNTTMNKSGAVFAFSAYFLWGMLPLYWKPLQYISAEVILSYRISLSFFTIIIILIGALSLGKIKRADFSLTRKKLLLSILAAALIAVNWFVYIYSVIEGYTLEASLGYYLTPMVNLLLGVLFLSERPGKFRLMAMAFAALAILILTFQYGRPPILALILAFSFGLYGFIKKQIGIQAMLGLGLETFWLLPIALFMLLSRGGIGIFLEAPVVDKGLILFAGVVTLTPLILFAAAAKRIPLYILGFFQYLAPTMMFIIGIVVFDEPFTPAQMAAFALVWIALTVFSITLIRELRLESGKVGL
jgi:chloramphenicol-sensitive protein RarD